MQFSTLFKIKQYQLSPVISVHVEKQCSSPLRQRSWIPRTDLGFRMETNFACHRFYFFYFTFLFFLFFKHMSHNMTKLSAACAPRKDSDQLEHPFSQSRVTAVR